MVPHYFLPVGKLIPRTRASFKSPTRHWYQLARTTGTALVSPWDMTPIRLGTCPWHFGGGRSLFSGT